MADADLTATIRAAARPVFERADAWRASSEWDRAVTTEQYLYRDVKAAQTVLDALPDDAPPQAAIDAVWPILRLHWPSTPTARVVCRPPIRAISHAVMGLRAALLDPPGFEPESDWSSAGEREARHAAWGLWLDLTTGLLPAAEVGEIRPGELEEELATVAAAAELAEPGWGPAGRQIREEITAATNLLRSGWPVDALRLLRSAAARLHALA